MLSREQRLHNLLLELLNSVPVGTLSAATQDYFISKANEIIGLTDINFDVLPNYIEE